MLRKIKGIVFIIFLLFLTTFGIKNSQPVRLGYYFNLLDVEVPLYALIFVCVLSGIAIGMLMGFFNNLGRRRTIKTLERENKELREKAEKHKEFSETEKQPKSPANG